MDKQPPWPKSPPVDAKQWTIMVDTYSTENIYTNFPQGKVEEALLEDNLQV